MLQRKAQAKKKFRQTNNAARLSVSETSRHSAIKTYERPRRYTARSKSNAQGDSKPEERSETELKRRISQTGHSVCRKILGLFENPNAFLILVTAWHIFNVCFSVLNSRIAAVGLPAHLSSLAMTATTTVASWITGTAASGIQTGGQSIKDLSFATTYYTCSFAIPEGIPVSQMLPTSTKSAAELVEEAADDFATAIERDVKLRHMSFNLAVFETEIHSLEMSLKIGKYKSPLLHNIEDYTTGMPALSESLGDFVSSNSASSGILLLATVSLEGTLIKLAQEKSQSNLPHRIKQTSHGLLGSWSPFTCLQAELVKAYETWLNFLERENSLRLIQSQQILAQFEDLEGHLREIKSAFNLAKEEDKAGLSWLSYEYWNGHSNPVLRLIYKRLGGVEEKHAHINLTQRYLHCTHLQYQEQDSKIKNLQAFLTSPAVYASHDIDDVTAASNLISRSVANLQATHRYLQTVQDRYVEALGRPIVQNGTIVIDFGTSITEEKSLTD